VTLAPLPQRDDHWKEIGAFSRQLVVFVGAPVGRRPHRENPESDERAQPRGEDSLGDAKAALKFAETARPIQGVTHDQQGPPVADDVQRASHGTFGIAETDSLDHGSKIELDRFPCKWFYYRTMSTSPPLPRRLVLLFAAACGLSVANVYFAHPLLATMARAFAIRPGTIGIVVTVTQIGYALGLIFIVPLGDLVDRRRLIAGQGLLSAVALIIVGSASSAIELLPGMFAVGLLAVVVQVLVAYAATLAAPEERGRVVGIVTSGVVVGILLARFVSGLLADLGGWRMVYFASAGLMLIMTGLLLRALPQGAKNTAVSSYSGLLRSVAGLFREEPLLPIRGLLAFLIFAAFNVLWAPLALPLSAPPFSFSHTEIGMIGLAGAAGALGAGQAGRLADRGLGERTTGVSLGLMLIAWLPIAFLGASLWALILGVIALDLAIQAVHVTSQSMLFAARPEARSRVVGAYMVFYSLGSATGAIAATGIYARSGWLGVCALGAAISALALVFWAVNQPSRTAAPRCCPSAQSGTTCRPRPPE
jgi:predicted MFS family arabinose efflux permease